MFICCPVVAGSAGDELAGHKVVDNGIAREYTTLLGAAILDN